MRGLKVEVWCEHGKTYLELSRHDVYPSLVEFRTIVTRWPKKVSCEPLRQEVDGRYCLVSELVELVSLPGL
jgi:hypothetical protein